MHRRHPRCAAEGRQSADVVLAGGGWRRSRRRRCRAPADGASDSALAFVRIVPANSRGPTIFFVKLWFSGAAFDFRCAMACQRSQVICAPVVSTNTA